MSELRVSCNDETDGVLKGKPLACLSTYQLNNKVLFNA